MSKSIILHPYEKQIAKEVPLLNKVLHHNHGRTRCEPIHFIGDTWDDDILPLRESLIRIEKYWNGWGLTSLVPSISQRMSLVSTQKKVRGGTKLKNFGTLFPLLSLGTGGALSISIMMLSHSFRSCEKLASDL